MLRLITGFILVKEDLLGEVDCPGVLLGLWNVVGRGGRLRFKILMVTL